MRTYATPLTTAAEEGSSERMLALAVVRQLMFDARSRSPEVRRDAWAFLADTSALTFWGDILDLDANTLGAYIRQTLTQS